MNTSNGPTSVYLVKNAAGELIYVGVTNRSHVRKAEHMATKEWASEIALTEWEHYGTRDEALDRELALIESETPKYNITTNHQSARRRMTMRSSQYAEWSAELSRLGERRTKLREELRGLSASIAASAREGHAAGVPKSEIARLAQITRPALDTMLKR